MNMHRLLNIQVSLAHASYALTDHRCLPFWTGLVSVSLVISNRCSSNGCCDCRRHRQSWDRLITGAAKAPNLCDEKTFIYDLLLWMVDAFRSTDNQLRQRDCALNGALSYDAAVRVRRSCAQDDVCCLFYEEQSYNPPCNFVLLQHSDVISVPTGPLAMTCDSPVEQSNM